MHILSLSVLHEPFDVRLFHREATALLEAGHTIEMSTPKTRFGSRGSKDLPRFVVTPIRTGSGVLQRPTRWADTTKALRRSMHDVWHLHNPELLLLALPARFVFRKRVKIVYDMQENLPKELVQRRSGTSWRAFSTVAGRVELSLAKRCDLVVAATDPIKKRFIDGGCEQVVVARNFPPVGAFNPKKKVEEPTPGIRAIYTGGVSERRGVRDMIECARLTENDGVKLTIVGPWEDPELRKELMQNCPSNVDILDPVPFDEISELLATHDVGLVVLHPTSHHLESLPVKLFEYLQAGLAVVLSDFPGWRDLLSGCELGIFVPPKNPDAMAGALRELLSDQGRLEREKREGPELAVTKFNWNVEKHRLVEAFDKLRSSGALR